MPVAALWVPEFAAQALRRSLPELAEAPLAVAAGPTPRDRLIAVTAEAAALGIGAGMTAAQARHVASTVLIRTAPTAIAAAAEAALVDVARSFSPRVRRHAAGEVIFDAGGLAPRWGSDERLAGEVLRAARRVGFEARIGIAGGAGVARVAARTGECVVVAAGGERAFVAALPLAALEPTPAVAATLARWGIFLAGELARLPRGEVRLRLGADGVVVHRLACGEENAPLIPDSWPDELREGIAVDEPIAALDGFLFVLRGVLVRLASRLALRGQGFAEVRLELALEGGGRHEVVIPLVAPTAEVATVLTMARLWLEADLPGAPVEAVAAVVVPGRVRLVQGGLFAPPLPAPGRLATALVRLTALIGSDRVGSPALADSHRPGTFLLAPFVPAPVDSTVCSGAMRNGRGMVTDPLASPVAGAGTTPVQAGTRVPAFRAFRPPRPADVVVVDGRPRTARSGSLGGTVIACAGPYRSSGEWWGDQPFAREEFDLATGDGVIWRLARDQRTGSWTAEGVYD